MDDAQVSIWILPSHDSDFLLPHPCSQVPTSYPITYINIDAQFHHLFEWLWILSLPTTTPVIFLSYLILSYLALFSLYFHFLSRIIYLAFILLCH